VADIDAIVRPLRFDGWQRSTAAERDVKQALRKALLYYKLHTDQSSSTGPTGTSSSTTDGQARYVCPP
jgi:hypothetical protein